ncbi:MAG: phosphate uptake regulator PhoU [Desulfovibrio sp.]|nr:MAG: phosphate uptake regulator PhoU [Desulfovibrio sp.]
MEHTLSREGIAENLRFMVLEVTKQVENTQRVLDEQSDKLMESIESRDDYIDNLKSVIENKCFSAIHRSDATDKRTVDLLRAVNTVVTNLERIADFAVNIVAQTGHLKKHKFIKRYNYQAFFKEILAALDLVYKAVVKQDMSLAFRICRSEFTLDHLYKVQFDRILGELRSGRETENLITSHLILRYLERMGDALLNVGEAIIFAAVGEKFKIRQYEALKETLAVSGIETPITDVEFHSIWGTRSGCRIGAVAGRSKGASGEGADTGALFKEGNRKKLLQERSNINSWEAILPGLPPRVLAFQEEGGQASLLIEFLGGCTFQEVLLGAEWDIVENAIFLIEQTLVSVWEATQAYGPNPLDFIGQITSRLDDVYRLHPSLRQERKNIGVLTAPCLEEMLPKAREIEKGLEAPYSVFIHGDFNINNIVYDHSTQKVHYIDLHRSRQTDPMQDISVYIVSNFRLPIFEPALRQRLNRVALRMFDFAREYAGAHEDEEFTARLALGLARSFITSSRFELNPKFARTMFQRGVYLLERIIEHEGRPWSDFDIARTVLTY